jgi:hypothetical protein
MAVLKRTDKHAIEIDLHRTPLIDDLLAPKLV